MQGARWWLVCYDVHDPERLRKAAHHLEGYGERMQYSVFRCWLTRLEMERLRWELTELLARPDVHKKGWLSQLWFVHAGSTAGMFSAIIPGWIAGPGGSQPVTKEVRP